MRRTDSCVMDSVTRTNCKRCRLEKCLGIGMKPGKVDMVDKKRGRVKATPVVITEEVSEFDEVDDIGLEVSEATTSSVERSPYSDSSLGTPSTDYSHSESVDIKVKLDIDSLVEECFLEESAEKDVDTNNQSNTTELVFELSFEEEATMEHHSPNMAILNEPTFDITFEEEFKIYELVVRKDSLVDAIFEIITDIPQFKTAILRFLSSGSVDRTAVSKRTIEGFQMFKQLLRINLETGGKVRACLDMFDEYKNVDEDVKYETFDFSLRIFHICKR